MPKTHINIWPRIVNWDNLYAAYKAAAAGKKTKHEVLVFRDRLEENITNIQNHLVWGSWRPSAYRRFVIFERKQRHIMAPPFCDRVVHHALVRVVEPLFEKRFIHHSYACRKGKGNHQAAFQVQKYLRAARGKWGCDVYVLQGDISKYFPSIPASVIKARIRRVIRDPAVLWLIDIIIDHGAAAGRGLPVGALTSQLMANIVGDRIDHLVKEELGQKFYVRYMDDWVVLAPDKTELWRVLARIGAALKNELGLELNRKTDVFPAKNGVDFCGYRIWDTHILPRKNNVKRAKKRFQKMSRQYRTGKATRKEAEAPLASFLGYMKHCAGTRARRETINYLVLKKGKTHDLYPKASNY